MAKESKKSTHNEKTEKQINEKCKYEDGIDVIIREVARDLTPEVIKQASMKVEKQYGKDYILKQIIPMPPTRYFFWFKVKVEGK